MPAESSGKARRHADRDDGNEQREENRRDLHTERNRREIMDGDAQDLSRYGDCESHKKNAAVVVEHADVRDQALDEAARPRARNVTQDRLDHARDAAGQAVPAITQQAFQFRVQD